MPASAELVYDADCPNLSLARVRLLRAFSLADATPRWREWRRDDSRAPRRVLTYGSPTILVNGWDIFPLTNDADCCRLYAQSDGSVARAPSVEAIGKALTGKRSRYSDWKIASVWLPAVGVAALPKLICPACWPAYAALAGALGMPFLLETHFLLPITLIALVLVLALLTWRAPKRRGYGPTLLGLAASVAITVAKFVFSNPLIVYIGASVLLIACVWNSWPRRGSRSCLACETPAERTIAS
jgi:mercuric ion transport protein